MEFLRDKVRVLKQRREETGLSQEEKLKRKKESEIRALILEVVFYLVFLACFLTMAFSNRDDRAFRYYKASSSIMDRDDTVREVNTEEAMWVWMKDQMLPFLYVTRDWTGRARNGSSRFVSTFAAYRLGPVRVRQHRVRPGSCRPRPEFSHYKIRCSPSWSAPDRDWGNYAAGWSSPDDETGGELSGGKGKAFPGNVTQLPNSSLNQGNSSYSDEMGNSSYYGKMGNSSHNVETGNSSHDDEMGISNYHYEMGTSSYHDEMGNSSYSDEMGNSSYYGKMGNSSHGVETGTSSHDDEMGNSNYHYEMGTSSYDYEMGNSSYYDETGNSSIYDEMGNASIYNESEHFSLNPDGVKFKVDKPVNSDFLTRTNDSSFHAKMDNSVYRSAWRYQTWSDIGGLPITGVLGLYPPGGYVLDIVASRAHVSLEYLMTSSWVDDRTRVVIVEWTIYSPNVNMFAMVTALFEFTQAGVVIGQLYMHPFRLFTYSDDYPLHKKISDWLVYLALVFFGIRQSYFIYRDRLKYLKQMWNIMESINLLTSTAAIALSVGRVIVADHVAKEANQDQGHFYNYQTLAMWDQLSGILAAFGCFLSTLQVLHLLRFNRRMSVLGATMRLAASELAPFSVVFLFVLSAFASFCYIMFGSWLPGYRSIIDTLETLMLVSLGDFDYLALATVNRTFAPLFIFLYMIFIVFLLINILITILMDSFADVREDVSKQPNDFELIDYIVSRGTHFLWNYNPFRVLWLIASYLGVVSHSTPESRRPETIEQDSDQNSGPLVPAKPVKRFLTKFQFNMAKVEIGLDKMEDTLENLWDADKIILSDIVLKLGSDSRRDVPAVGEVCLGLHAPVMVAMRHGLDSDGVVPSDDAVENISDLSYDTGDLETNITFTINISEICSNLERGSTLSDKITHPGGVVLDSVQDTNSTVSDTLSQVGVVPKSCATDFQSGSPDETPNYFTVPKLNSHDTRTPDSGTVSPSGVAPDNVLTRISKTPSFRNVPDYVATPVSPFLPDYMRSPFSDSSTSTPAHVVPSFNFHDTSYPTSEMASSPGSDVLDYSMQDTSQAVSEMTSPRVPGVVRKVRQSQNFRKRQTDTSDDQTMFPRKWDFPVQNKKAVQKQMYSVDVHEHRFSHLNDELQYLQPGQEESQV